MNQELIRLIESNAIQIHGDVEYFAELVAAAEREACAALCEARFTGDLTREDMEAKRCAAAIRARGEA
jgi:hypothetical protein